MTLSLRHTSIIGALSLALLGVGCSSTVASSLTPEEASASLTLTAGSEIVLRPTVLGLGGALVGFLGAQTQDRQISVTEWIPGSSVGLAWSITTQTETAASVAARAAYEAEYGQTAIGEEIPKGPEPAYEVTVQSGTLRSDALADATTLGLPETWAEGDTGVSKTSLIWISRAAYDELVNTRSTHFSLGLFDESLMQVGEATGKLTSYLEKIKSLWSDEASSSDASVQEQAGDLLTVEADADWGATTLLVDGVRTRVRTIEARNAFGSFTILAHPDNPLLLELRLTPLSQGNLEVLSPSGFLAGFGGYEVSQINKKTGG
ncbi:hypothetical protein HY631_03975 [Candidatus Uhrbacteria bacterium]|nr:hypothetical protein [Candidatus Uhrbacteria bacterium]